MSENNSYNLEISPEEYEEYKEAFDMYDKDGSGSISVMEFIKALKNMGQTLSQDEINNLIQSIDGDNSGEIDFNEFLIFMVQKKRNKDEEDLILRAFKSFDKDKDGKLSINEFKYILCNLGHNRFTQDDCDLIFSELDLNQDGYLDYVEFIKYWRNK